MSGAYMDELADRDEFEHISPAGETVLDPSDSLPVFNMLDPSN